MKKVIPLSLLLVSTMLSFTAAFSQVEQQWVQRFSTSARESPIAIKTDGANVYVLGVLNEFTFNDDFVLIKYNSTGAVQWTRSYSSEGAQWDKPNAMTLDGAGNVYITGRSSSNAVTIKYNASGVQQWVAKYLDPDHSSEGNAIAVDASGNVYITGTMTENTGSYQYDYLTIKYNAAGVQQWVRTYNGIYNGTESGIDVANFIALDATGNIYITGESFGQIKKGNTYINTFFDFLTIKYAPNGKEEWRKTYNGPGNNHDQPQGLVVDGPGNVYVTGGSRNMSNNDYYTVKYDTRGRQQWEARFNGPADRHDSSTDIAIDGAGNVYVTGFSENASGNPDYLTIKYNSSGIQQWFASYNGPVNGIDIPRAIGLDIFGNVYVTGESQGPINYDYATVKYSSTGSRLWVSRYNGPANGSDKAIAMAVFTPSGPAFSNAVIYVTGPSDGVGTGLDIATIKYNQPLVIDFSSVSTSYSVYPNPATDELTIEHQESTPMTTSEVIDITKQQDFDAVMYNSTNIEVWKGKSNDGKINVDTSQLPKGLYVFHVLSPEGREVIKVKLE